MMEKRRQEKTLISWMPSVVISKITKVDCMEAIFENLTFKCTCIKTCDQNKSLLKSNQQLILKLILQNKLIWTIFYVLVIAFFSTM